ncbi:MAG: zinc ABC transporter substrate-binding protein [Verrucomicrobiota bacterium]|nr:zinc ABC transporter substrate-binding protein [Verrucomicrobiota bacterium]
MQIWSFIFLFLAACSGEKSPSPPPAAKPLLLVTIAPYQTLVQEIAGDGFDVQTVVPVNADPHMYEPTSRQVTEMQRGQVWFRIGEPFEKKLIPLLAQVKKHDLREGVAMIEEIHCDHCTEGHGDRHIWLSPKQLSIQAEAIAEQLTQQFPDQAGEFGRRLVLVQEELADLDRDIQEFLSAASIRTFLVSHPAFAYFCRDYGCEQLSIEQEGKDPRPKEIEQIFRTAKSTQTQLAIALPQHNNKGAQLIAEQLRIPVRWVDPYAANYEETLRKLAGLIANPYEEE